MELLNIPLIWLADGEDLSLARAVEAGLYAEYLIDAGRDDPRLEPVAEEGRRSCEVLWWVGLRVAGKIAMKVAQRTGVPQDDIFQDAALAVATAIRAFDHTRGFRYTTFVHHVTYRALADIEHLRVFASAATRSDRRAARRATRAVEDDPDLSLSAAAAAAGLTPESVARGGVRHVRFDPDATEDEGAQVGFDQVAVPGLQFLDLLSPRHRDVLHARYLSGQTTLEKVSARLMVSDSTVLRWERDALRVARDLLNADRTMAPWISPTRRRGAASDASQAR